ncbi:MAG TPA: hypothetical protein VF170_14430, partial [Planctomycetaceae bacterium]
GETRNFPGWNCTADADGCHSVIDLLTLMVDASWTAQAHIPLTAPTQAVASLPGGRRTGWQSPSRLRLRYPAGKVDGGFWRWTDGLTAPTLTVGRVKVEALRDAFRAVANGQGDFCIHADGQPLHGIDPERMSIWFW